MKRKSNLLLTFVMPFLLLCLCAANASAYWVTEAVDSGGDVGYYTSMALDGSGYAHISYYDIANEDLKYATNASGSWVIETVDSTGGYVGYHTSIALDSSGYAHISYGYASGGDLRYATNKSGYWATEDVDSAGNVGRYTSIALDSSGEVHISYYDITNGDLKYATNASGSWVTETVDSDGDVGQYTSIALDSEGHAHIAYYDATNDSLKIATGESGSWAITGIPIGACGQYTSIGLDSSGYVHISCYDITNGNLWYVTNKPGGTTAVVDSAGDVGKHTSIALDSSDKPFISYYDETNHDLKVATNESGSWVKETVDSDGDVGRYTSIALDSSGQAHIIYYDQTNGDLKYVAELSSLPSVPYLPDQFENRQIHGDPLAFWLGVGFNPYDNSNDGYCHHYQGLARMDHDGTPYFFLTRNGNRSTKAISPCHNEANNPGELLIVKMGSRDTTGERLRSNRLERDIVMRLTEPPTNDRGVKTVYFHGQDAGGGNNWPSAMHPGGIQIVDGVLAIAMDNYCPGGWNSDPPRCDYFPDTCGPDYLATWECEGTSSTTYSILLVDVADPENPTLLENFFTDSRNAAVAVTKEPDGTYVFATIDGETGDYTIHFYVPYCSSGEADVPCTDLRDPSLSDLVKVDTWHRDELSSGDPGKGGLWSWQTLNFVRGYSHGADQLYLIGGDNHEQSSVLVEPLYVGEDMLRLFEVNRTDNDFSLSFVSDRRLRTERPQMGNLKAAGGVYVSPSGNLIVYTGHHATLPELGDYVHMGEFRSINVDLWSWQRGAPQDTCGGWVELYWEDWNSDRRSLMFDYKDRWMDNWENLNLYDNFEGDAWSNRARAVRWNLAEGQIARLYDYDDFGGSWLELEGKGYCEDLNEESFNEKTSSVRISPVADPGGPYVGYVKEPIDLMYTGCGNSADPLLWHSWGSSSASCNIPSVPGPPTASITCSEPGDFTVTLTTTDVLMGLTDVGSTTVSIRCTEAYCDDSDVCNGTETCDPATGCQAGIPLNCDDGNVCNGTETCIPASGCEAGIPLNCDDGDACNGTETCDPATGCQAGTPLNCDDGDVCTGTETCYPASGCQAGIPLSCDDGDVCDGTETCDPAAGCQAGIPLNCDDGDACTNDSCDPLTGCQNSAVNCDDSNPCTEDTCDVVSGCQNTCLVGNPCTIPGGSCQPETQGQCTDAGPDQCFCQ